MNILIKISELQKNINGVPIENIRRMAASKSISQSQFADFIGISVTGLREKLKQHKIRWRNTNGRIIKRKLKNNSRAEDKINSAYYNAGINSRIKPSFGSGFYNVR